MKTHNNIFEQICSFENLHLAFYQAARCKRSKNYVLEFCFNLEENLLQLQKELLEQTYQHGFYQEFLVCDSKKRRIKAAPFRDRIVHHALCNIIEPIFDKGFIFDSYACRSGKGTHRAIKRLEKFLKKDKKNYCLKCDIAKYFNSIDHQILFRLVEKKIADKKVLRLTKEILKSSEETPGKGIPIGNLTSQLFANVYLNELDQFVKHRLRVKRYLRYMDDFLVLGFDKKKLHQIRKEMEKFLWERLELKMHPKKVNIFPVYPVRNNGLSNGASKGIDFLGYRLFGKYRLLRKSTVKRFVKRVRRYKKRINEGLMSDEKLGQSLQSWLVYARFGNSWRLCRSLSKKICPKQLRAKFF